MAAAIFGVVSVLVVADLTRGTGRFNFAQGAVATATAAGGALSLLLAEWIVQHCGYNPTFLALAAIAAGNLAFFWFAMPETSAVAIPLTWRRWECVSRSPQHGSISL